jgi:hypothetical protein
MELKDLRKLYKGLMEYIDSSEENFNKPLKTNITDYLGLKFGNNDAEREEIFTNYIIGRLAR